MKNTNIHENMGNISTINHNGRTISFYVGLGYPNHWIVFAYMDSPSTYYNKCSKKNEWAETTLLGKITVINHSCGYTDSRLVNREMIDHVVKHVKQYQI